ncbi:hypothetical protein HIM_00934 [Hirsutella minnesotensis 3608]|nr:hypothetical protein HIM_00934 [Hirsutella minnesotensis 3608]
MERFSPDEPPPFDCSEPPSYSGGNDVAGNSVQPPTTLRVVDRFVYSDDAPALPLYELSRTVEYLSDANSIVTFERLQQVVKYRNGSPQVSTRPRHLYDLKHPSSMISNFLFHADAVSRQTLCSFAIISFRPRKLSTARGYQIVRVARGPDRQLVSRDRLFTALPSKDTAVAYEWFDAQGRLLARELQQSEHRSLLITAEMRLDERDALAAAWLMKIWWRLTAE